MKQQTPYITPQATVLTASAEDVLTMSELNSSRGESIGWNEKLEIC